MHVRAPMPNERPNDGFPQARVFGVTSGPGLPRDACPSLIVRVIGRRGCTIPVMLRGRLLLPFLSAVRAAFRKPPRVWDVTKAFWKYYLSRLQPEKKCWLCLEPSRFRPGIISVSSPAPPYVHNMKHFLKISYTVKSRYKESQGTTENHLLF